MKRLTRVFAVLIVVAAKVLVGAGPVSAGTLPIGELTRI